MLTLEESRKSQQLGSSSSSALIVDENPSGIQTDNVSLKTAPTPHLRHSPAHSARGWGRGGRDGRTHGGKGRGRGRQPPYYQQQQMPCYGPPPYAYYYGP